MLRFAKWALLAALIPSVALGQEPQVAPELLDRTLHGSNTEIRFCIGEANFQRPLEEDLAHAIADALLVEADIFYYPALNFPRPYDYALGHTFEDIFVLLTNECDAFMGMSLAGDPAGDWLTFSRPLYDTDFALVGLPSSELTRLDDLDASHAIGTRLASTGDLRLGTYLRGLPAEARPRRFPYNDNLVLFENLLEGEIDTALLWRPALERLQEDVEGGREVVEIELGGLRPPKIAFGIAYLANNVFLRTLIDGAVAALVEDGTLEAIAIAHNSAVPE